MTVISIQETRDSGLIAALNAAVQNLHAELHPDLFKPYERAGIEEAVEDFFRNPNCQCFVAWQGDIPVGYVLFFIREMQENAFQYAVQSIYIDQLSVEKTYRRAGIARMLLEKVEELAMEKSISKIELDHWSSNETAAVFFRKKGFQVYKERLYKFV